MRTERIDSWREQLGATDRRVYEQQNGAWLARLDYPLDAPADLLTRAGARLRRQQWRLQDLGERAGTVARLLRRGGLSAKLRRKFDELRPGSGGRHA